VHCVRKLDKKDKLKTAVMCVVMESDDASYEKTKLLHAVGNEHYDVFSRALEILMLSLGGLKPFTY
jgi:hypothetical protein